MHGQFGPKAEASERKSVHGHNICILRDKTNRALEKKSCLGRRVVVVANALLASATLVDDGLDGLDLDNLDFSAPCRLCSYSPALNIIITFNFGRLTISVMFCVLYFVRGSSLIDKAAPTFDTIIAQ